MTHLKPGSNTKTVKTTGNPAAAIPARANLLSNPVNQVYMLKKISMVIVDDHKLIRETWEHMLQEMEGVEIIGTCGELEQAIEMITAKKPDIVLLDINLPPSSGFDAVPLIREHSPGTRIIALSMHTEPAYARKMMNLGAHGYVTKNSSWKEIMEAIHTVQQGKKYLCNEVKDILSEQSHLPFPANSISKLSTRELEIIMLIKAGLSSKDISIRLGITLRTAEAHRYNILKRLNLKNTASLVNFIHQYAPQIGL